MMFLCTGIVAVVNGTAYQRSAQTLLGLGLFAVLPALGIALVKLPDELMISPARGLFFIFAAFLMIHMVTISGGLFVRALLIDDNFPVATLPFSWFSRYLFIVPMVLAAGWSYVRYSAVHSLAAVLARRLSAKEFLIGCGFVVLCYFLAPFFDLAKEINPVPFYILISASQIVLALTLFALLTGRRGNAAGAMAFVAYGQTALFTFFCRPLWSLPRFWQEMLRCLVPGLILGILATMIAVGIVSTRAKWWDIANNR